MQPFNLNSPDVLRRLSMDGPLHLRALAASALGLKFDLHFVAPNSPTLFAQNLKSPRVVIFADDDGKSLGPRAFSSGFIRRIAKESQIAIIHALALDPMLYSAAGTFVMAGWSTVLVETRLAHAHAWHDALERANPRINYFNEGQFGGTGL